MSVNWFISPKESTRLLPEILKLEQNWQSKIALEDIQFQLSNMVDALRDVRVDHEPSQNDLYEVIDFIFDELAFSGPGFQELPESALSSLSYCIMARTGNHMSLAVVINHFLNQVGFNAYIAELENEVALVVKLNNSELIIIDSVSGATEYLITNDDSNESLVNSLSRIANPIPEDELIKEFITEQKICLLAEGHLEEALACVETMMMLLPEDPYEHRDRGIVLQQLNCDHHAEKDLRYFIKACPNDPMATVFKHQLDEQNVLLPVLH
jgi:regulator of sirC expression with transglutaminase-like and TPR domain